MPPLTAQSSERFSCTSAPSSTASGCGSYHAFHAPPPVSSSSSRTAAGMSGAGGMRSARASRSACSAAIQTARMALESDRASGGRFVAIASIQSRMGVPYHTGYVASKHALEGFCAALRYDLEGTGVTVLTVHPHWMRGTNLRANACAPDGGAVGENRRSHGGESVTVQECAAAVLAAVENRDTELVIPSKLRLVPWLKLFWPGYIRHRVWRLVGRQKK